MTTRAKVEWWVVDKMGDVVDVRRTERAAIRAADEYESLCARRGWPASVYEVTKRRIDWRGKGAGK